MRMPSDPERLRAFLADPRRPPDTLQYHELQGFLFAVLSAPALVRPPEWLPFIFGDAEARYASVDEAQAVLGAIMALYNELNDGILSGTAALPPDCRFRRGVLANLERDAPVSQWARGFTEGHLWLEELWDAHVPPDLEDEFGAILMTLGFFASRSMAEALLAETGKTDLRALAMTMRRLFSEALAGYAHIGRMLDNGSAPTG